MTASGQLLPNLLLFGRLLRGLGLDVNPGRMIDLVDALAQIELGRRGKTDARAGYAGVLHYSQ